MVWSVYSLTSSLGRSEGNSLSRQGHGGEQSRPRKRAVCLWTSPAVPTFLALGCLAKLSRTHVYQSAGLGWATVTNSPKSQWLNATKACFLLTLPVCPVWS